MRVYKPELEADIHARLCLYLRAQYKDTIFTSDASGLRMTIGLAKKWKYMHSENGIPDLFILDARRGYFGLLIELKRDRDALYKKSGDIRRDNHILEQEAVLKRLQKAGYRAIFAAGFKEARDAIDNYMAGPVTSSE